MKNFPYSSMVLAALLTLLVSGCGQSVVDQKPSQGSTNGKAVSSTASIVNKASSNTTQVVPVIKKQASAPTAVVDNLQEVAKHNNKADCWLVIDGKIYDITKYIPQHPGGEQSILKSCGRDATKIFTIKHGPEIKNQLGQFYLANLVK